MIKVIKNWFYWALDYAYVVRTEFMVYTRKGNVDDYRNDAGKPVIVIPGIYENWRFVRPIAKVLHAHGYDVHVLDELGYNRGAVEEMAEIVRQYVDKNCLQNITIVSHSKGGLIGKLLLSTESDGRTFKKLIALNAPFSGSFYAYAFPQKSLRIFTPTSPIIRQLSSDTDSNKRIVSIYGIFDPHIPKGSALIGAVNIQLKTYGHFRCISDTKVHQAILNNID